MLRRVIRQRRRYGYRLVEIGGLLLFLLLGWLYGRETPLLETPDEPSHFSVVKYIADTKSLPPPIPSPEYPGAVPVIAPGVPTYYAPPLYYALAAALIQDLDTSGFAEAVIPNPSWARGWAPTPGWDAFNKNAYVHTAAQHPPSTGWAAALVGLRRLSLLLGAVTVMGTYFLARQLWPALKDRIWVWLATALVAFNATYLFTINGVTNDALLIALSTWSFVLMGSLLTNKNVNSFARWQEVGLALLVGLAILTKQSAFFLVPLAVVAVAMKAQMQRWSWRRLGAVLLAGGLIVSLIAGWWYVYNGLVYGDFLGLFSHLTLAAEGPTSARFLFLIEQAWGAFKSYWAAFGWALIFVHPGWYLFFSLLTLGGLWGWLRFRSGETAETWPRGMATILAGAVLLNGILLVLWMWRIAAPYGRLLFPAVAPLACLIVEGWRRWLLNPRLSRFPYLARLWQVIVLTALVTLAAIVPFHHLRPAFASPLVDAAAMPEMIAAPARFGSAWRLLGYQVTPGTIVPGEAVDVTLYWQAAAIVDDPPDLMVFVQLAPQDLQKKVISRDEFLGTSRYPTSTWQPGDVVAQQHRLDIPAAALAPALYWFNVGLYEDHPRRDLTVYSQSQPVVETTVRLGPVRMRAGTEQPQPPQQARYDFAATIRLNGYGLKWRPETSTLAVDLYWQALASPTTDWNVFVHLVDEDGNLIAQHDGPPQQGNYPTYWWLLGDRVIDRHVLVLPVATIPEGAQLKVGLYNWLDGQRLPVTNAQSEMVPEVSLDLVLEE